MLRVRVQPHPFDMAAEMAALCAGRDDIGGIGAFVGIVRASSAGPALEALSLEHYPGMTERAMTAVGETAVDRWALIGCTLVHRVGRLGVGEPIVLVLAASAHRRAALDATAFLIDWLKTKAPFWKQEHFAGGATSWVEARAEDDDAAARWDAPSGA